MKKQLSIIMTAAIMLSLSSCGLPADVYTTYKNAYDKTSALQSSEMDFNMKIQTAVAGKSVDVTETGNAKIKKTGEKTQLIEDMNITTSGISQQVTAICSGDKYFMKMSLPGIGEKIIDLQFDSKTIQSNLKQLNIAEFQKDMAKTIKSADNNDGEIDVTLDGTKFSSYLKELIENNSSSLGQAASLADKLNYKFSDVGLKLTIDKNGYISKQQMNFKVDLDASGLGATSSNAATASANKISMTMDMTITMKSPGQKVEFTLPDVSKAITLAQYQEMLTSQTTKK